MNTGNDVLKRIQKVEIEALGEIQKVCNQNEIHFFLRGGSALGAIKYQGFVPWDDDIDIAIPRADYLRFVKAMPKEFENKFLFVSYQKTKNAHCYFPRIILKKEYCRKMELPQNNERGLVLIDVLPLDGMPNSTISRKIHIIKAYFYRVLASLWTLDVKDTVSMHGGKKESILKFMYAIKIHRLYKQDAIYKKLDKLYTRYKFGETENAGMLASSKLRKEIIPYKWWGSGRKVEFCGLNVYVPEDSDSYLKQLFGDNYLTMEPPAEERTKSHLGKNQGS